jgi:hypothetical protein
MNWCVAIQILMVVMVALTSLPTYSVDASATNESGEHSEDSVVATTTNLPGRRYVNYDYDQFFNVFPCYIVVDENVDDTKNEMVRELASSTSDIITTIAGNGNTAYRGDNGAATSAGIYYPCGVALDASGRPRHSNPSALF